MAARKQSKSRIACACPFCLEYFSVHVQLAMPPISVLKSCKASDAGGHGRGKKNPAIQSQNASQARPSHSILARAKLPAPRPALGSSDPLVCARTHMPRRVEVRGRALAFAPNPQFSIAIRLSPRSTQRSIRRHRAAATPGRVLVVDCSLTQPRAINSHRITCSLVQQWPRYLPLVVGRERSLRRCKCERG